MFILIPQDASNAQRTVRQCTIGKIRPNLVEIIFLGLATQPLINDDLFFAGGLLGLMDVSGELRDLPGY